MVFSRFRLVDLLSTFLKSAALSSTLHLGLGVCGGDFGGLSKPTMVQLWRRGNRVKPLVLIGLSSVSETRHDTSTFALFKPIHVSLVEVNQANNSLVVLVYRTSTTHILDQP